MNSKNNRIWEIIAAYLCGEKISDTDKELLHKWIEDEENRCVLKQLECYYREQQIRKTIDVEKACLSVFEKIRRQKRRMRLELIRWWGAIAAIIILGVITATMLLHTGTFRHEAVKMAQNDLLVFNPAEVTLQLTNGMQIALKDNDNFSLQNEYGTICNYNGTLSFKVNCPLKTGGESIIHYVLRVPRGKRYQVILPDGTQVCLNADSKLYFPPVFGENKRSVFLEGEAYFDVKKAKGQPFIAKTNRLDVKVTGTRFNIKAYRDEESIYTTLLTGEVQIIPDKLFEMKVELKPSQQYSLNRKSMQQNVKKVDPSLYVAWIDQMFVFRNQRLEDVMKDLTKWYDVEFVFDDTAADMKISGNIECTKDLTAVLDMIKGLRKVTIEKQNEKYVIRTK